jgi:hypothetical protein
MIDFNTQLKDIDGQPLLDNIIEAGLPKQVPVTLARIAANALLQNYPDEANLAGAEKVKRFELAMKVSSAKKAIPLVAEDIALIKERIAKAYGPLVVGRAWQLLDGAK